MHSFAILSLGLVAVAAAAPITEIINNLEPALFKALEAGALLVPGLNGTRSYSSTHVLHYPANLVVTSRGLLSLRLARPSASRGHRPGPSRDRPRLPQLHPYIQP
jgi:hypothetical protein